MIKNVNKMIAKIVFLISNFVACFIPGGARRHKCRGQINMFLLRPFICRFIKKICDNFAFFGVFLLNFAKIVVSY
jgi:hypothetical protein